ncbi:phage baseplate assembly protein W [Ancylobacter sp. 3268]|uniref:phage baseplate protein n=1 Tax=Ancylobacter sp. 3268 TaxID=2817752 RepID=UPI002866D082|nr:phage baseplate protein [Ancylobacter sp. 3268]MDR6952688.1 phage baseplate assembly protein W [Ancylobacter sp. 3268]
MLDRSTIRHVHWQLAYRQTEPSGGGIVTGYDDIEQEILIIATTPKGSVPCNPEKGCDILPYIDRPPAEGLPLICREIWMGLATWVSRIEVLPVEAVAVDFHHFKTTIPWRVKDDVAAEIRRTELGLWVREGLVGGELL